MFCIVVLICVLICVLVLLSVFWVDDFVVVLWFWVFGFCFVWNDVWVLCCDVLVGIGGLMLFWLRWVLCGLVAFGYCGLVWNLVINVEFGVRGWLWCLICDCVWDLGPHKAVLFGVWFLSFVVFSVGLRYLSN